MIAFRPRYQRSTYPMDLSASAVVHSDAKASPAPERVLLTFQGGGAKGIVHVGGLAAVEDLDIKVIGVAGTSAGAMIAALVAAGYSSGDMLDHETGGNLLKTLGDSFARKEGIRLDRARDFFDTWWFVWALRAVIPLKGFALPTVVALILILATLEIWQPFPFAGMDVGVCLLLAGWLVCRRIAKGVGTVGRVRKFVDHAIAGRLGGGKDITFRQMANAGGLPLKIVATNVTDRQVEVFSYERTPDVAVADAVAASICLPIVFQPWAFECRRNAGVRADQAKREYLDGGITSNLPVWTLDRERDAEDDVATIAFSIVPDEPKLPRPGHWAAALIPAIIAGSMEIHTRAVDRMVHVPIGCSLKLFDFDKPVRTLCEAVGKARAAVADRLENQLLKFPAILRSGCRQLSGIAADLLREEDRQWWANHALPTFRVAFAVQAPHEWQFSIPYHDGYGDSFGPTVDQEVLQDIWDTLEVGFYLSESEDGVANSQLLLVPVSQHDGIVDQVGRKSEQPLVVVIESNIEARHDLASEGELQSFLSNLALDVVAFTKKYRVYEAVQRSTETP